MSELNYVESPAFCFLPEAIDVEDKFDLEMGGDLIRNGLHDFSQSRSESELILLDQFLNGYQIILDPEEFDPLIVGEPDMESFHSL